MNIRKLTLIPVLAAAFVACDDAENLNSTPDAGADLGTDSGTDSGDTGTDAGSGDAGSNEPYPFPPPALTVDLAPIVTQGVLELTSVYPEIDPNETPQVWFRDGAGGTGPFTDFSALYVIMQVPSSQVLSGADPFLGGRAEIDHVAWTLILQGTENTPFETRRIRFVDLPSGETGLAVYADASGAVEFAAGTSEATVRTVTDAIVAQNRGMTYEYLGNLGPPMVAYDGLVPSQLVSVHAAFAAAAEVTEVFVNPETYIGPVEFAPAVDLTGQASVNLLTYTTVSGPRREEFWFTTAPSLREPFGPGRIDGSMNQGYRATVAPALDAARCAATVEAQFPFLTATRDGLELRIEGDRRPLDESAATLLRYPCIDALTAISD